MNAHTLLIVLLVMGWIAPRALADEYHWRREGSTWTLSRDGHPVGHWTPADYPGLVVEDRVQTLRDGVFRLQRVVRNAGDTAPENLRLCLDFVHAACADFAMIPAVTYNGNTWGRGKEPKGFQHEGEWWSFSSRRTPIPGATYSEGPRWAVALWAETTEKHPVPSCSLMPATETTTHRLIWPEEEQPLMYLGRDRFGPGTRGTLHLDPGQELTLCGILVVDAVQPGHRAMARFLSEAWGQFYQPRKPQRSPDELWQLAMGYARESLWAQEGPFCGFSIGLTPSAGGWVQRTGWKYEIGWCGQNASLANSLLVDYLRNRNEESLQKGLACLDAWATHCVFSNGLFRTHFDWVLGLEGREILDGCNLGTAALNYFEAHDLAAQCGQPRPNYRTLALNLCRFMVKDQEPSGRYGKGWTPDGDCVYREGTIGAFLIPPILEAHRVTSDDAFLQSALKAFSLYYGEFETHGYTSAGALDTWCIDKESAMPLLRAALVLHEVTGDKRFLNAAEHVSWYLSTWLWHISAPYPEDSDFASYGYDPFGGTSVSTQHHHLDSYALFWVRDWLDLAERTGEPAWREKAQSIWFNANQLVSDGTLDVHGRQRPAGSQNEAFFHAAWGGGFGTINDWLVAWPGAFRLETLRKLRDWDALAPTRNAK